MTHTPDHRVSDFRFIESADGNGRWHIETPAQLLTAEQARTFAQELLSYAEQAEAEESWSWRHRECGPDCCITGDLCEDDDRARKDADVAREFELADRYHRR